MKTSTKNILIKVIPVLMIVLSLSIIMIPRSVEAKSKKRVVMLDNYYQKSISIKFSKNRISLNGTAERMVRSKDGLKIKGKCYGCTGKKIKFKHKKIRIAKNCIYEYNDDFKIYRHKYKKYYMKHKKYFKDDMGVWALIIKNNKVVCIRACCM